MPIRVGTDAINYALLCESIRQEFGAKYSILGALIGEVKIGTFPGMVQLACFMEYVPASTGRKTLHFRFVYGGVVAANIQGDLDILVANAPTAITIPTLPITMMAPGTLSLDVSLDQIKWRNVLRRDVVLGAPPIFSNAPPPPSAQSPPAAQGGVPSP
jgi:hypothetical protein